jgi:hypothetical protein
VRIDPQERRIGREKKTHSGAQVPGQAKAKKPKRKSQGNAVLAHHGAFKQRTPRPVDQIVFGVVKIINQGSAGDQNGINQEQQNRNGPTSRTDPSVWVAMKEFPKKNALGNR